MSLRGHRSETRANKEEKREGWSYTQDYLDHPASHLQCPVCERWLPFSSTQMWNEHYRSKTCVPPASPTKQFIPCPICMDHERPTDSRHKQKCELFGNEAMEAFVKTFTGPNPVSQADAGEWICPNCGTACKMTEAPADHKEHCHPVAPPSGITCRACDSTIANLQGHHPNCPLNWGPSATGEQEMNRITILYLNTGSVHNITSADMQLREDIRSICRSPSIHVICFADLRVHEGALRTMLDNLKADGYPIHAISLSTRPRDSTTNSNPVRLLAVARLHGVTELKCAGRAIIATYKSSRKATPKFTVTLLYQPYQDDGRTHAREELLRAANTRANTKAVIGDFNITNSEKKTGGWDKIFGTHGTLTRREPPTPTSQQGAQKLIMAFVSEQAHTEARSLKTAKLSDTHMPVLFQISSIADPTQASRANALGQRYFSGTPAAYTAAANAAANIAELKCIMHNHTTEKLPSARKGATGKLPEELTRPKQQLQQFLGVTTTLSKEAVLREAGLEPESVNLAEAYAKIMIERMQPAGRNNQKIAQETNDMMRSQFRSTPEATKTMITNIILEQITCEHITRAIRWQHKTALADYSVRAVTLLPNNAIRIIADHLNERLAGKMPGYQPALRMVGLQKPGKTFTKPQAAHESIIEALKTWLAKALRPVSINSFVDALYDRIMAGRYYRALTPMFQQEIAASKDAADALDVICNTIFRVEHAIALDRAVVVIASDFTKYYDILPHEAIQAFGREIAPKGDSRITEHFKQLVQEWRRTICKVQIGDDTSNFVRGHIGGPQGQSRTGFIGKIILVAPLEKCSATRNTHDYMSVYIDDAIAVGNITTRVTAMTTLRDEMAKQGVGWDKARAAGTQALRRQQSTIPELGTAINAEMTHLGGCIHLNSQRTSARSCPPRTCTLCKINEHRGKICTLCKEKVVALFRTWVATRRHKLMIYETCIRPMTTWACFTCKHCQVQAQAIAEEIGAAATGRKPSPLTTAPTHAGGDGYDPQMQITTTKAINRWLARELEAAGWGKPRTSDPSAEIMISIANRQEVMPASAKMALEPLQIHMHPMLGNFWKNGAAATRNVNRQFHTAIITVTSNPHGMSAASIIISSHQIRTCRHRLDNVNKGNAAAVAAGLAHLTMLETATNTTRAEWHILDVYTTNPAEITGPFKDILQGDKGWIERALDMQYAAAIVQLRFCNIQPLNSLPNHIRELIAGTVNQQEAGASTTTDNQIKQYLETTADKDTEASPKDESCRLWNVSMKNSMRRSHHGPVQTATTLMRAWHEEEIRKHDPAVQLYCEYLSIPTAKWSQVPHFGQDKLDGKAARLLEALRDKRHKPPRCKLCGREANRAADAQHIFTHAESLLQGAQDKAHAIAHNMKLNLEIKKEAPWDRATLNSALGLVPREDTQAERIRSHMKARYLRSIVQLILRTYVEPMLFIARQCWGYQAAPDSEKPKQKNGKELVAQAVRYRIYDIIPHLEMFSTSDGSFRQGQTKSITGSATCVFTTTGGKPKPLLTIRECEETPNANAGVFTSARGAEAKGIARLQLALQTIANDTDPRSQTIRKWMAGPEAKTWFHFSDALTLEEQYIGAAHATSMGDRELREHTHAAHAQIEKEYQIRTHLGWIPRRLNEDADKRAGNKHPTIGPEITWHA